MFGEELPDHMHLLMILVSRIFRNAVNNLIALNGLGWVGIVEKLLQPGLDQDLEMLGFAA